MDRRRVATLVVLVGVLAAFAWLRVTFPVEVDPPAIATGGIGQDTVALPPGPWVVRCPGPLGSGTPSWYFDQGGGKIFVPVGGSPLDATVEPSDPAAGCAGGEGGRWAGAAAIAALALGVAAALGAVQRVEIRRRELERNPLA